VESLRSGTPRTACLIKTANAHRRLPRYSFWTRSARKHSGVSGHRRRGKRKQVVFLISRLAPSSSFHLTPCLKKILAEKRCILTITRPNGATRSYTLKPKFAHKAEARAVAAVIAVDMGAIDFIKHGSPEVVAKRGLVLAPLMRLARSRSHGRRMPRRTLL
jgi:hypothetical protein